MSLQVFIDGQFHDEANAKVSVFDHTLLYGDGVFEGIRVYEGCVFRLHAHIDRLWDSAKYIMLTIPMTKEEMIEATAETVRRNGIRNGYIRLVISRGAGGLGLAPWKCPKASVIIIAATIQLYSDETYKNGMRLMTAATLRTGPETFNPRVKSCNYLNNIMAKIEAHNAGFEEALMLNQHGQVVECSGDNVFIVKGRTLFTPPIWIGALRGVTRDCLTEIARERGYEVLEEPFTRYEMITADECFLTGTAAEAIPVVELDGRPIGTGKPGPITQELIAAFRDRTTKDGVQVY